MKFNKWTLGLAAVGAVSLASAVRADEAKLVPVNTALSSTVISGYVDIAAQYNVGNYGPFAGVPTGTTGNLPVGGVVNKVDNFTLNDIDIALDHPQDESPWAAGYHIDLNLGTDAVGLTFNNIRNEAIGAAAIRQGYVILRTPVGNGIDWKVGVQDDIIGYEGNTDGANPNYTRSLGYSVEPTTLLGIVGAYKVCDSVTLQAGLANATSPGNTTIFGAGPTSSDKTLVGAISFTAPDSFGFAKGATLTGGALLNLDKGGQDNYYVGLTMPTPSSMIKVGAAFDLVSVANEVGGAGGNPHNDSGWVLGLYTSIAPTDKLSFNLRGEYYDLTGTGTFFGAIPTVVGGSNGKGEEFTATIQYNLWANVISRAEFRWDHADEGGAFSDNGSNANSFLLAANLIYTF